METNWTGMLFEREAFFLVYGNTEIFAMDYISVPGVGDIKVRRSANIKYLRIRMAPGRGIWVSVPYGVGRKQVEAFVSENREWILHHRREMQVYEKDTGVGLGIGSEVKTKQHTLKIERTGESNPAYRIEGEVVTLFIPEGVCFDRVEKYVQQFLVEIYKLEAEQYLPGRVKRYAEQFGFRYGRLSFRDNVSNWGSCSFENNISLNVKLMKLPDELIDYVILHELCHTVEKNHSDAFWKLVGLVCPDYVHLRARLRKYNTRV